VNIAFVEDFKALPGSFAAPQGEVLSESIGRSGTKSARTLPSKTVRS